MNFSFFPFPRSLQTFGTLAYHGNESNILSYQTFEVAQNILGKKDIGMD